MVEIGQNFLEHEQSTMLGAIFVAKLPQRLCQSLVVNLMVNGTVGPLVCLLHRLVVALDQTGSEFGEE